jgi:hypothetical protein
MSGIKLTKKERLILLQGFNQLKSALQNIDETQDLWLSDIKNLDTLRGNLHMILKFEPHRDRVNNQIKWWENWKLGKIDD